MAAGVANSTLMDNPRFARGGETALSPERKRGWRPTTAKKGARGGNMVSPTPNIVKAVLAAAAE
jgi:hypothetical protein